MVGKGREGKGRRTRAAAMVRMPATGILVVLLMHLVDGGKGDEEDGFIEMPFELERLRAAETSTRAAD